MVVLRKDFIIDPVQIIESALVGVDAILLIVAVLQEKTLPLLQCAHALGMDAIVEVHSRDELAIALDAGADMIGINNRNLTTFSEDINTCLTLARAIPSGVVKIAESAIKTPCDAKRVADAGFDAMLIGEALVTSPRPDVMLASMRCAQGEKRGNQQ